MTTVTHEDFPVYSCIADLMRGYRRCNSNTSNSLTFEESEIYKYALNIDINKDSIEIPILFRRNIAEEFYWRINQGAQKKDKVIIPLYTNFDPQVRRTSRTIMNQFFNTMSDASKLVKITTCKGDVYYGGKGIILDENFKPLLLLTIKAEKSTCASTPVKYTRFICHVSPKIFEKQDEMFIKYIIKKVFPVLTKYEFTFPTDSFSEKGDNTKFKIIIDDFDEFFIAPIQPKPEDIEKDNFNQTLIDNVDEIVAEITNSCH